MGSQTKIERNKLNKLLIILFILKNNPVGLAENKSLKPNLRFDCKGCNKKYNPVKSNAVHRVNKLTIKHSTF